LRIRIAPPLKSGCFETGSHCSNHVSGCRCGKEIWIAPTLSQLICSSRSTVFRIKVSEMEGNESLPFCHEPYSYRQLDFPSSRLDDNHLPFFDAKVVRVLLRNLDKGFWILILKLFGTAGLGTGMEMMWASARRELQWILLIDRLEFGEVMGMLENGTSRRVQCFVLCLYAKAIQSSSFHRSKRGDGDILWKTVLQSRDRVHSSHNNRCP
jgi:hypothetical protein